MQWSTIKWGGPEQCPPFPKALPLSRAEAGRAIQCLWALGSCLFWARRDYEKCLHNVCLMCSRAWAPLGMTGLIICPGFPHCSHLWRQTWRAWFVPPVSSSTSLRLLFYFLPFRKDFTCSLLDGPFSCFSEGDVNMISFSLLIHHVTRATLIESLTEIMNKRKKKTRGRKNHGN